MYAHLLLFEKIMQYKRSTFPNFYSIHKNNPALVASILLKKSTSTVFVRFLQNTFNFTRFCAFTQKTKFYALKMLKNKISRILKLPSWQHCDRYSRFFRSRKYPLALRCYGKAGATDRLELV